MLIVRRAERSPSQTVQCVATSWSRVRRGATSNIRNTGSVVLSQTTLWITLRANVCMHISGDDLDHFVSLITGLRAWGNGRKSHLNVHTCLLTYAIFYYVHIIDDSCAAAIVRASTCAKFRNRWPSLVPQSDLESENIQDPFLQLTVRDAPRLSNSL